MTKKAKKDKCSSGGKQCVCGCVRVCAYVRLAFTLATEKNLKKKCEGEMNDS